MSGEASQPSRFWASGRISIAGLVTALVVVAAVGVGMWAIYRAGLSARQGSGLPENYNYDLSGLRRTDRELVLYDEWDRLKTGLGHPTAIALAPDGRICLGTDKGIRLMARPGTVAPRPPTDIKTERPVQCLAVAPDGTIFAGFKDHVEIYDAAGQRTAWESLGEKANLTAVALWKDEVFLADAGNRIVLRCDRSGKVVGRIGQKDAVRSIDGFVVPSPYFDLAVAPDGLLRVANPGRHRVEAYTFAGDLELSWGRFSTEIDGFCGCCNPANLAVLPSGEVVTCEKGLARVKLYSPKGEFVGVVAGPEVFGRDEDEEYGADDNAVLDVAVDKGGTIFVLDPATAEVVVFTRK